MCLLKASYAGQPVQEVKPDIDVLASALYNISALRRELQRLAGMEHAVSALTALSAVQRIGPARISDVAAELEVSLSVASRRIQVLQDAGLVERVGDPDDGRCSLIAISTAGVAKLRAAHHRIVETLASSLSDWSADEVAGLAEGLVRLRIALASQESRQSEFDPVATARLRSAPRQHAEVRHEERTR